MGEAIISKINIPTLKEEPSTGQPPIEIQGYDSMEPFLMTLVSDTDLWMYVSSLGSLTGGRVDEDHAVFPYCVEDVIHRSAGRTGPATTLRVWREDGSFELWEPFSCANSATGFPRKLTKTILGNCISFEERHERLGLVFRYRWAACDRFGFVRTAELVNEGAAEMSVDIVDGLLNLMPASISYGFNARMSVLVDAYTECEIDPCTGIAIVSLASLIVDKPEPGEALFATVAWSRGLDGATVLLSEDQLPAFRRGGPLTKETAMRGRRANLLLAATLRLPKGASKTWDFVADAHRSQTQVENLKAFLEREPNPSAVVHECVAAGAENLARIVSAADSQQCTADQNAVEHHQACVLFNVMRGGIYGFGYEVPAGDFRDFVSTRNTAQATKHRNWLDALPENIHYSDLLDSAKREGDTDLTRITYEYLPLTFSRRHGDPSRPWNRFAIRLKNADGSPLLAFEGNWRDIFQNWEALSLSYPMFLESIIAKFVNASTVDGFNPYRITREGVDWEVPSPDDPWSSMGYWGDHQIIYLLKFLELAKRIYPESFNSLLVQSHFTYANVPLRIRPYKEMVKTPHSTVDFDHKLNKTIEARVSKEGTDAKLLPGPNEQVWHVTLTEKLLVPALAKLSNLVLDAGIWMNTQRPEWNDANNALVGNGVSMVTLCYLRRYLAFCKSLFEGKDGAVAISTEVVEWLQGTTGVLEQHLYLLNCCEVSDDSRRTLLDELGAKFSDYRAKVYESGFSGTTVVSTKTVVQLCDAAIPHLDHSIRANRRDDGLYHAYNLVDLRDPGFASVNHLYEMLEGQVAVLSAGVLDPVEVCLLIDALFESKIYRQDQATFMLYPDRALPRFLEKNVIPALKVDDNPLLAHLLSIGDSRIVLKDASGKYRFAPSLQNAEALSKILQEIAVESDFSVLVAKNGADVLDVYESVFGHRFFTGRSGAMYAYEGLGSIYWHMVSKLLVAVQEAYFAAEASETSKERLDQIAAGYYRIRSGMGFNKSPQEFGAFPADPYSHTPAGRGAKQPGMTGQSKEDILARWSEFGVFWRDGRLEFRPSMLRLSEFSTEPQQWTLLDLSGAPQTLELKEGSLAFTVCGVPVVYELGGDRTSLSVELEGGELQILFGSQLTEALSKSVSSRKGKVKQITVTLPERQLLS